MDVACRKSVSRRPLGELKSFAEMILQAYATSADPLLILSAESPKIAEREDGVKGVGMWLWGVFAFSGVEIVVC